MSHFDNVLNLFEHKIYTRFYRQRVFLSSLEEITESISSFNLFKAIFKSSRSLINFPALY